MKSSNKLLVITGPTASGKTKVAMDIASKVNVEIISADSMLVYEGMDIGTDKPTVADMGKVKHHMIDIVKPNEEFNVALYKEMVEELIADINARGELPLLVGGTGLYIKAVIDDYDFNNTDNDPDLRAVLLEEAREKGSGYLHERLYESDPTTAKRLHPNDTRRIIRALEVLSLGQNVPTGKDKKDVTDNRYKFKIFGLHRDRKLLYERINNRVNRMIDEGLVEEVRGLLENGYGTDLVSMKGLGYKEIAAFLEGRTTLEEAIHLLKRNTRRFAKRQLTWFRKEQRIKWIDIDKHSDLFSVTNEIITGIEGL